MAWYVESKYDQMRASKKASEAARRDSFQNKDTFPSREIQRDWNNPHDDERISDMLDVKNMERSLDKKYSSMKSQPKIEDEPRQSDLEFDVKKLEENLIRFEESRVGNTQMPNSSQAQNFSISEVSKIGSLDERINRRNSNICNWNNRNKFWNNFNRNNTYIFNS